MERRNFIKGSLLGLLSTVFSPEKKVDAKEFKTEAVEPNAESPTDYNLPKGSGFVKWHQPEFVSGSGNISDIVPTKEGVQKLTDILSDNIADGDLGLVWGPELNYKYIPSNDPESLEYDPGNYWTGDEKRQRVIDRMQYIENVRSG